MNQPHRSEQNAQPEPKAPCATALVRDVTGSDAAVIQEKTAKPKRSDTSEEYRPQSPLAAEIAEKQVFWASVMKRITAKDMKG